MPTSGCSSATHGASAPFRALAGHYDMALVQAEDRLGHYFLINLTMAFVREP
jgi:hypothetical protein